VGRSGRGVSKLTFFIKKMVKCTAIDIRNAKLGRFLRKSSVFEGQHSKVASNWHFENRFGPDLRVFL